MFLDSIRTQVIEWGTCSGRIRATYGEGVGNEVALDVHWPCTDVWNLNYGHHEKAVMHLIEKMTAELDPYRDGCLKEVDWALYTIAEPPKDSPKYRFEPLPRFGLDWHRAPIVICSDMFPVQNFPDTQEPQFSIINDPTK